MSMRVRSPMRFHRTAPCSPSSGIGPTNTRGSSSAALRVASLSSPPFSVPSMLPENPLAPGKASWATMPRSANSLPNANAVGASVVPCHCRCPFTSVPRGANRARSLRHRTGSGRNAASSRKGCSCIRSNSNCPPAACSVVGSRIENVKLVGSRRPPEAVTKARFRANTSRCGSALRQPTRPDTCASASSGSRSPRRALTSASSRSATISCASPPAKSSHTRSAPFPPTIWGGNGSHSRHASTSA